MNETMKDLDQRIRDAVARSMAKGVSEKEAFAQHMMALASEYPKVFAAYTNWLIS